MKTQSSRLAVLTLLAAFSGVGSLCGSAHAQSFTVVPNIPNGNAYTVYGVANGGLAAGDATRSDGAPVATSTTFRWSGGGINFDIGLDSVGTNISQFARGISAQGNEVVGWTAFSPINHLNGSTAFRWTGPGTYQPLLPSNGLPDSRASAVSADGSIVAGIYGSQFDDFVQGFSIACYWDSRGSLHQLTGLPGVDTSADAISGNGQVIVGRAYSGSVERAFRWSQQDGYQQLPSLTGVPNQNSEQARGANFDGSIVVGESNFYATKWVNGEVVQLLSGVSSATALTAWSVSSDGSVIGGILGDTTTFNLIPAIWTESTGFIPATDYLAQHGIVIPTDFALLSQVPISVSSDGRSFGGTGYSLSDQQYHGWVATIPAPDPMVVSISVFAGLFARRRRCSFGSRPL